MTGRWIMYGAIHNGWELFLTFQKRQRTGVEGRVFSGGPNNPRFQPLFPTYPVEPNPFNVCSLASIPLGPLNNLRLGVKPINVLPPPPFPPSWLWAFPSRSGVYQILTDSPPPSHSSFPGLVPLCLLNKQTREKKWSERMEVMNYWVNAVPVFSTRPASAARA